MVDIQAGAASGNANSGVRLSFEFFPPRSDTAKRQFAATVDRLAALGPDLMTVTYGAGGSTADPTLEAVLTIRNRCSVPVASHLTYVSTPIWEVATFAQRLADEGIVHVVALRGDPPRGRPRDHFGGAGFYHSSPAFVASLKTLWGFDISVSAYPEKHPDTPTSEGDIEMLGRKQDAGASRAITQFFFDNAVYYRFRDDAAAEGVTMPVVPGLLPILDFEKMCGFAARCGASVPAWLHARFAGAAGVDAAKIAEAVLIEQAADLIANGVDHLHIFTLNEAAMTERLSTALGLGAAIRPAL
jgi:methylenetetrahydrofolate reductase (NADPH)